MEYSNKSKVSICVDCAKSGGLCAWSRELKPVDGWKTASVKRRGWENKLIDSVRIVECPLFEPEEREEKCIRQKYFP
jgi:hypothetical protein